MPKSIINKKQYKVNDFGTWVIKWLRRAKKRQKDLADELLITQPALSYKIEHSSFSYGDMLTIIDYLDVPEEEIISVMKM